MTQESEILKSADGSTILIKLNNLHGSIFLYNKTEYYKDCYTDKCYKMSKSATDPNYLKKQQIKEVEYKAAFKAAIEKVESECA